MVRTDLALEAKELWDRSAAKTTQLQGVRAGQQGDLTCVDILDERGEKALGKPVGTYVTLNLPSYDRDPGKPARQLGAAFRDLMALRENETVMVVGLGNEAVTPDALGPRTAARVFPTRHLIKELPKVFGACRSVSVVCPGVLATTGVETLELVRGAVENVKPHCLICIDALAAGSTERLCNTVQFCNSGIAPGSGVGNCRAAFSRDTLGIPVYAIGVPTVTDSGGERPMMVTPRDIDDRILYLSRVLAGGINIALHPEIPYEDFIQFVPQ